MIERIIPLDRRSNSKPKSKSESKSKAKSKSMTSAPAARRALFGEPKLLPGEDLADYNRLLTVFRATVKPVDFIEEMYLDDVVYLEWEVLRWRRLKTSLIRTRGLEELESFLRKKLDYDWTSEHFADHLAETLWINCPKVAAEDAQTLARHYVREEADAIQRINAMLGGIGMDFDDVLDGARADKAKELVHGYVRREPDAVTLVEELLAGANASIDTLTADRIRANLEWIERFDRLTAMAESRRNISLHEIERHRAGFAEALRRGVQAVEDAEFEVIETPARGKNAA